MSAYEPEFDRTAHCTHTENPPAVFRLSSFLFFQEVIMFSIWAEVIPISIP